MLGPTYNQHIAAMSTPTAPAPEPLAADVAQRLAEFARACKAATKIVALYPATHPSIQSALARIVDAGTQATANGPFAITVLPDNLLVGGRAAPRSEPAIVELSALLHQHRVGELSITGVLDRGAWHTFLSLLARTPEDLHAAGGIARAWMAAGGAAIELHEIDYLEVLRERGAGAAAAEWDAIIANCLQGDERGGLDADALSTLLEIARDPVKLAEFTERLQERSRADGIDPERHNKAVLHVMHGLANYAARTAPQSLDAVLDNMAGAVARLTPDAVLALLTDPPPRTAADGDAPMIDLGGELHSRLTDDHLSRFVADNVVRDRGASDRLAEAFHTLVPEPGRRQVVLAQAETRASQSALGQDSQFETVWSSALELLMQYSDADYVSKDYARELSTARSQAVEVERVSDDPPERIGAWLRTMGDEEIRALDQLLVTDLLRIEDREEPWTSVLDIAIAHIDQLVLVGDLRRAHELMEAISSIARSPDSRFSLAASAGLSRLAAGPLVSHLILFIRQATDAEVELAGQFCLGVGIDLIPPLAAAMAIEDNARTVRRLRDVLIAFGPAARTHADELRKSKSPAVRRAAVELLRAIGGEAALADLRSLLDDSEAQVQRDALRAIVQIGTPEAYASLEQALKSGAERTRDTIMQALGTIRDERAVPLFVYILKHTDHRGALEPVYASVVESLGRLATDGESVAALKEVLYRGEFWAPRRTARLRAAAARALRATTAPEAEPVLQEAASDGPRGVRAAARAALALPAGRGAERSERKDA
jgi:hypothetical protein